MQRKLLALVLLVFFSSLVAAEWTELLRVVVTDLNGYPVANAQVTVEYQKNRFLALESVKVDNPPTKYECVSSGTITVSGMTTDPVTGAVQVTYNTPSTSCNYGQTYFEAGNLTPTNLTGASQLGADSATEGTSDDAEFEQNVVSVPITITRFDLSKVDGKITGATDQFGIFEVSVRNHVPDANATDEYLVKVGSASRRVRRGDNFISGAHVENFVTADSFSLLPVQVVDAYGKPVENAFVQMSCSNTKNGTTDAEGMIYIYTRSSCKISAEYGQFNASSTTKLVPEVVVGLAFNRSRGVTTVTARDSRNKPLNSSTVSVKIAGMEMELNSSGVAVIPPEFAYGSFATVAVKSANYSLVKSLFLIGSTRFSLPTNQPRVISLQNFNNTLVVTVVDENGAPFANALVSIPGKSEKTPPDGTVRFDEVHVQTVRVEAIVLGVNKTRDVTFYNEGETAIVMEFKRNPLGAGVISINHTFERGCKVTVQALASDPRLERQADIALTLSYGFVGEKKESRQLLVSANGTTSPVALACPSQLPATLRYNLAAADKFGNYTSPAFTYIVPEPPQVTSVDQALENAVDQLTILTGSETNAIAVVTVIMVAFIIAMSIAALTVLVNRRKAKEMVAGKKEGDEPPMPRI